MYLEETKLRRNGKVYRSYLLRESYREKGKVKHRTLANLSRLPNEHIEQLKLYFKGKGYFVPKDSIGVKDSKEYGASYALLEIARALEMDKMIYSVKKQWRKDILAKYKVGKYFDWKVEDGSLNYTLKEDVLAIDRSLDGCYVIRTDAGKDILSKEEAVESYKRLSHVEEAFRNFKTVLLEVRPVFHHNDERIISHVFICMLAYYLKFHMEKRLEPLFEQDKSGKDRSWTFSKVIERLKSIRVQEVKIGEVKLRIKSTPDEEQKMILDMLGIRM